jgi:N-acetylmuramic acid 6-phosphate etherase
MSVPNDETLEGFLAVASQFKLGSLVTESPNPITEGLSTLCKGAEADVAAGLKMLQAADRAALESLLEPTRWNTDVLPKLKALAQEMHETLLAGHCVIFEGCGATGRLSLSIEVFCREGMVEPQYRDQIKGFMAGGDAALISSIEKFEDREEFGRQQLRDIGFVDGDLLVAITEGGETPFVIAACEEATVLSKRKPWFLYCNPDDVLCQVAERSDRVLKNVGIEKINLCVGPMAITGSTRMQATTVQLLAAGLAIQYHAAPEKIDGAVHAFAAVVKTIDYGVVAPLTVAEAALYANGDYFLYSTDRYTLTVMTDTTERSPTFSLPSFENFHNDLTAPGFQGSTTYMHLGGERSSHNAWNRLLRRAPRGIDWPEVRERTGARKIYGFDFSDHIASRRAQLYGAEKTAHRVSVTRSTEGILLQMFRHSEELQRVVVPLPAAWSGGEFVLLENLVAKVILNAHSTALMGRNGRFESNIMTWVRPSNNKLIDRAARYVALLLKRKGCEVPAYEKIVEEIFACRPSLKATDPIVLVVLSKFCPE